MDRIIKVFAAASVSNVGPGFDILGYALNDIGDTITMSERTDSAIEISCPGFDLPTHPKENVAGVALQAMLDRLDSTQGFNVEISKNVLPGSGLGSSASSAAAAVFGANELLGNPFTKTELVEFAMAGEALVSGKPHADNVAPSLLGGFVLVRSYDPLHVVRLQYPKELVTVIIHPQIEVKTSYAKEILPKEIPLTLAVKQWGNIAGLVSGLAASDFDLIGSSLKDVIIELVRSHLIPGFYDLQNIALTNGALGCSISGSGPSVFALCVGEEIAEKIETGFGSVYDKLEIDYKIYRSFINDEGTKLIS